MADVPGEKTFGDIKHTCASERMLFRVPVHEREEKKHIFVPAVVSFGPYHHRQHQQSQPLKIEVRDMVCGDTNRKTFLESKIRGEIVSIKSFYGGADGYDDEELIEMMLCDACFLVSYIRGDETCTFISRRMGTSWMLFMLRDVFMLENQIPLWLIFLIDPNQLLLCRYLSNYVFGDNRMTQLPWGNGEEEPIHLLEALYRIFFQVEMRENSSFSSWLIRKCNRPLAGKKSETVNNPYRSVTDLEAKGIHFRPSSTCLTNIKFSSFFFYAQLHLPRILVSDNSKVLFSNLIAFEMSPGTHTYFGVTSYINILKGLIQNAKDVKVLREKGILYRQLPSDEEVVRLFNSIDTYGFTNNDNLSDVNMKIEEHCNGKARKWMAKFQNPCTVIALSVVSFLLCLNLLQTYFKMNPLN